MIKYKILYLFLAPQLSFWKLWFRHSKFTSVKRLILCIFPESLETVWILLDWLLFYLVSIIIVWLHLVSFTVCLGSKDLGGVLVLSVKPYQFVWQFIRVWVCKFLIRDFACFDYLLNFLELACCFINNCAWSLTWLKKVIPIGCLLENWY